MGYHYCIPDMSIDAHNPLPPTPQHIHQCPSAKSASSVLVDKTSHVPGVFLILHDCQNLAMQRENLAHMSNP
jgi:hypothetical protein